ncbi:hypothetical protein PILCRDRAFT_64934 [Piloderma croceum F 1598]|uniref:Cytochrome P450 n=1 Tax=Piloderma croceum (strain F 1598) TaxID=765440 RepID=A0A0C3G4P0_PILCF|nr:hypothetical protein PILCRDRAFT_64934 [Piloderma croceum F 1598]
MLLCCSQNVNYLPGITAAFEPLGFPGVLFPTSKFSPGVDFPWNWRFSIYKKCNTETISILPFLIGKPSIYTSNLDVARQVVGGGIQSYWIKPEDASTTLLKFGMNLAAAEKDTWRRHRRIMGPAFNNTTYALVWDRTVQAYKDMIAHEGWSDPSCTSFDEPIVQRLTFKLALLIIGSCGFGFDSFSWNELPRNSGEAMSVQESWKNVSETVLASSVAPKWFRKLPIGWIREMCKAHETLNEFMHAQIADRKREARSGAPPRNDVFSILVRANEDDVSKYPLDDTELVSRLQDLVMCCWSRRLIFQKVGNVFLLLIAGHETTGHTLAATLGLLGLYQDVQDEILQHILDVVGPTRVPTFADYDALFKVLGAFQEALRMFPAGSLMIRIPTEDTLLSLPNPIGEQGSKPLPVSKGQRVIVDMIGVQYNPRYFPEPEKYKPSRWYGAKTSAEVEFSAFSIGPRQCIGRKFATTEAVAFLTLLVRDWKVEPLLNAGETTDQWRDRVMQGEMMLTLGVRKVPIRFTRRTTKV